MVMDLFLYFMCNRVPWKVAHIYMTQLYLTVCRARSLVWDTLTLSKNGSALWFQYYQEFLLAFSLANIIFSIEIFFPWVVASIHSFHKLICPCKAKCQHLFIPLCAWHLIGFCFPWQKIPLCYLGSTGREGKVKPKAIKKSITAIKCQLISFFENSRLLLSPSPLLPSKCCNLAESQSSKWSTCSM